MWVHDLTVVTNELSATPWSYQKLPEVTSDMIGRFTRMQQQCLRGPGRPLQADLWIVLPASDRSGRGATQRSLSVMWILSYKGCNQQQ